MSDSAPAAGPSPTHDAEHAAVRAERRWAALSTVIVVALAGMAAFAGIHQATMPQRQVETIDPKILHLGGEFVETNLGSAVETDGSVTVRVVGQQYSFTPACIVVPADTPIRLRATSPDVVHGLLIEGTNINTMLVPGYVSELPVRFATPGEHLMPCQEFCSVGHEGMWARVKVVSRQEFATLANGHPRVSCVQ
jgi:cytochrome c oxidase subunit 2